MMIMSNLCRNVTNFGLLLVVLLVLNFDKTAHGLPTSHRTVPTCGYESCHPTDPTKINVHIVPHTHDDVGWLKTVDQYYFGSKSNIQKAGVQIILDSVIDELKKNPSRRFIWVETAFLLKWLRHQHDITRHRFQALIRSGQMEIIGGAWTMNDEATTHYQSVIDQFTWGLKKLNESYGECGRPKVGWQIDPFGHSREMANIFDGLGYDGLLLGRIDYQDKKFRFQGRNPEFYWVGSDAQRSSLLTSVMYNTYSPPPGFCFDILCDDEPIIDDKKSPEYNVDKRVLGFLDYVKNVSSVYRTNNVIVTMGEDFNYQDARVWFDNLDKLIYYANELQKNGSPYNLIYSTPSCYLHAVKSNSSALSTKTDDFFPYASDPNSYWTGYFTSRPTLKRYERVGNNLLQVCKQQYALADLGGSEDDGDLNALREAMGVMQHHDAVAGTEKEHVAYDYARILSAGLSECEAVTSQALNKLTKKNSTNQDTLGYRSCPLLNISSCEHTENNDKFVVTIYNPLSRPVKKFVRVPINAGKYQVFDPVGKSVTIQILPIAQHILRIPGRNASATDDLVFLAEDIPPLGFKSYFVEKVSKLDAFNHVPKESINGRHVYDSVGLYINQSNGLLAGVNFNGKDYPLVQDFAYYRGTIGDNAEPKNRSSGAYIFRPNGTSAYTIKNETTVQVFTGNLVLEVHQNFDSWLGQIIRIYLNESFVEFDWVVGPIPTDTSGKEIITRFVSEVKSEGIFYTDSNGRQLIPRVRNARQTWKLNLTEPISSNYYPIVSKILIKDDTTEVAVLTDRAQGGSSLQDGQLELMIHRECLHDDAFGVGEPLRERAFGVGLVARGSHYLFVGPSDSLAARQKDLAQRKLLDSWTFISPLPQTATFQSFVSNHKTQFSGLKNNALAPNVQILTLEPWKNGNNLLVRLEHVFEPAEDKDLSQKVTVDLKNLFAAWELLQVRETALGADRWIDKVQEGDNRDEFSYVLEPYQIRTFVVDIKRA